VGFFIGIYFALGIGSATLVVVQTLILWILCSIEVRSRAAYATTEANARGRHPESYTREWLSPSLDHQ
jgi:hypothetical protein